MHEVVEGALAVLLPGAVRLAEAVEAVHQAVAEAIPVAVVAIALAATAGIDNIDNY